MFERVPIKLLKATISVDLNTLKLVVPLKFHLHIHGPHNVMGFVQDTVS